MNRRINAYYEENPAPLGSTDRKCPVDADALFGLLNEEPSELAPLWAAKAVTSWVGTLGSVCEKYTPIVKGGWLWYSTIWVEFIT